MKYFRILQYGDGENYETKETIITEPIFRQYQKLIAEGKEKLVLEDRIISVSSIKEIIPAGEVVAEYQRQGVSDFAKLPAPARPQITGRVKSAGDFIKENHHQFYEKMGFTHKNDCICKWEER